MSVIDAIIAKKLCGGGGSSVPTTGGVTTLHINVTAVNFETKEATFTADKTPVEMQQASATGPTWCVVSFAAGVLDPGVLSIGIHPAWAAFDPAFGLVIREGHGADGNNQIIYAVRGGPSGKWVLDLNAFQS